MTAEVEPPSTSEDSKRDGYLRNELALKNVKATLKVKLTAIAEGRELGNDQEACRSLRRTCNDREYPAKIIGRTKMHPYVHQAWVG